MRSCTRWLASVSLLLLTAQTLPAQSAARIPDYMYPVIDDAGRMSIAAYGNDQQLVETLRQEGWGIPTQIDFPSGLHVGVWQRNLPGGNIERMVAFVGTKDLAGAAADLSQGLVGPEATAQYRDGLDFALKQVAEKDRNPNLSLTFTGHSLGGGIAQEANLETGVKAVVFNAAPLNGIDSWHRGDQATIAREDLWNLRTKGDVVSALPLANQYGRQLTFETVRPASGQWTGNYSTHSVQALLDAVDATRTSSAALASTGRPGGGLTALANRLDTAGTIAGGTRDLMRENPSAHLGWGAASQGLNLLGGIAHDMDASTHGNVNFLASHTFEQSAYFAGWGLSEAAGKLADLGGGMSVRQWWNVSQNLARGLEFTTPVSDVAAVAASQIGRGSWLPDETERTKLLDAAYSGASTALKEQWNTLGNAATLRAGIGVSIGAGAAEFVSLGASRMGRPVTAPWTVSDMTHLVDGISNGLAYGAGLALFRNADMASGTETLVRVARESAREWTMPLFQFAVGAGARAQIADQWSQAVSRKQTTSTLSEWMGGRAAALNAGFSSAELDRYDSLVRPPRNFDPFRDAPVTRSRFSFTTNSGQFIAGTGGVARIGTFNPMDPMTSTESTRTSLSYSVSYNPPAIKDIERPAQITPQPELSVHATPPAPVVYDQGIVKRGPQVYNPPPSPPRSQPVGLTNTLREGGLSQQVGVLPSALPMSAVPKLGGIDMTVDLVEVDDLDFSGQSGSAHPPSGNGPQTGADKQTTTNAPPPDTNGNDAKTKGKAAKTNDPPAKAK